jgi:geranylgeranyl pyrophosphate synthase
LGPIVPESCEPAAAVAAELARAEERLAGLLASNDAIIAEICHYLVEGAGKRLRPTFLLLVYRACGGRDEALDDAIDAAVALELIHSATLLHDDIIDAGALRRGKPSAFKRYGLAPSLVTGDYLFCRAFELCGRFEERLVHTAARACIMLTEGEAMEARLRHNTSVTLGDYMEIITRKTASLFSAAGRVAADLAQAPTRLADAMAKLGNATGLAFQMTDDLLDILGPEAKIGKPTGCDLRTGIPSLPLVLGLESDSEVRRAFSDGALGEPAMFERITQRLRAPRIQERARMLVDEQIKVADEILTALPLSPYRAGLTVLIEHIGRRV